MADQNELKAYKDFVVDNETTFISVEVGQAIDTSMDALSNRNFPIDPVMALPVNDYTEDTTSPVAEQLLLLDYDEGLLWFQFNEPVNISSINYTLFSILQDSGSPNSTDCLMAPGHPLQTPLFLIHNSSYSLRKNRFWLAVKAKSIRQVLHADHTVWQVIFEGENFQGYLSTIHFAN